MCTLLIECRFNPAREGRRVFLQFPSICASRDSSWQYLMPLLRFQESACNVAFHTGVRRDFEFNLYSGE
jgi:hypothetical protein